MARVYFYNEDCIVNMDRMAQKGFKVDLVLTSPPYGTSRSTVKTEAAMNNLNCRYDICLDKMTEQEYCDWTVDIFNHFDQVLTPNGVVLYNISYGSEYPNALWLVVGDIIKRTNFMIADCIIWKKKSALPNNVGNKLTRITEFVFVLCRKDEFKTFNINKKVKSISRTGQKYYENVFNFIEAANNDGTCKINKATYSSDLCLQLLDIYANENTTVFDPFMGTGTTAVACEKFCQNDTMMCIGCELSEAQIQFSKDRLAKVKEDIANGTDKDVNKRKGIKKEERTILMPKPTDEEVRNVLQGILEFSDIPCHTFFGSEMKDRQYHAGETTWSFPKGVREKIQDDKMYHVWYTSHSPADPYDTSTFYHVYYIEEA